jgi:hypothetical protein
MIAARKQTDICGCPFWVRLWASKEEQKMYSISDTNTLKQPAFLLERITIFCNLAEIVYNTFKVK